MRVRRYDAFRQGGAQPGIAAGYGAQRELQFTAVRILEEVARWSGDQRATDGFVVAVHRDDDDACSRVVVHDPRRHLQAVEPGHGNVDQGDVGPFLAHQPQRFAAVAGLRHYLDARQLVEERAHPGTHQRMVIGEQEPQRAHAPPPAASGKRARIVVPRPGAESISKSPPARATRSCMLSSPWLAPCAARRRAAATSNPWPSSRTTSCNVPAASLSSTSTLRACAWRMTLVRASCAMRKQVVSTAIGGRFSR